MWVEKTAANKYKYVERYKDPYTGKEKRVSITLDKNTKQAQKQAQEALYQKINSADTRIESMTLGKLTQIYLNDQERTVKMSTFRRNSFACASICKTLGKDVRLDNLTAGYIRKKYIESGKAAGTVNESMTRLKALIRWAYKNDYITNTSCIDKLEKFKDTPHAAKIENKFLEKEEVSALLNKMKVKKWHDLTAFLVLSGLRIGEALALLPSDLDCKERVIHVTKTYDLVNGIITSPKTRTSVRDVYMQKELYELCKELLSESYINNQIININADLRIFEPSITTYPAYEKYLRENASGITDKKVTAHLLRHTHASLMLEAGMDVDAISERLGHNNSKITREIYLHITERTKRKQREQIDKIKLFAP